MKRSDRREARLAARSIRLSAVIGAACLLSAIGCGDSVEQEAIVDAGAMSASQADGGRAPYTIEGCVVSVLATDCASGTLPNPHDVELLNASTGEPLPGFKTRTSGGKYSFKNVPGDIEVALHAIGVGPVSDSASTYDSIAFYSPDAGDNLLRVSSVGTAGLTGMTAAFTPADDRVPLSGAVYQINDAGKRIGTIGCAQLYLDDQPHPAESMAQRYNASSGIPTTTAQLDKTLAGSGRFYFGNLSKGQHTLKVTLDGGKTFISERKVFIGRTRADALSPFKSVLYLVAIEIKGTNPTPAGCATEEKR